MAAKFIPLGPQADGPHPRSLLSGELMRELGEITFREFAEVLADPPAETIGFDITSEDEGLFGEFLDWSAGRRE